MLLYLDSLRSRSNRPCKNLEGIFWVDSKLNDPKIQGSIKKLRRYKNAEVINGFIVND